MSPEPSDIERVREIIKAGRERVWNPYRERLERARTRGRLADLTNRITAHEVRRFPAEVTKP